MLSLFHHSSTLPFFATGCILQASCGVLLFLGGLATRARRLIGPFLIAIAIGIAAFCVVCFAVFSIPAMSFSPFLFFILLVIFLVILLAQTCVLLALLWLPLRFFLSPRVLAFCRGAAA
jgi:hypothetical protein